MNVDEKIIGAAVLRPAEAAACLGLSAVTLQRQRTQGEGPKHLRLTARAVGYRRRDLDEWLEQRAARAST